MKPHIKAILSICVLSLLFFVAFSSYLEWFPESSFNLAQDSRLPLWFNIPTGLTRADIKVTMGYYIDVPFGRVAVFKLLDKNDKLIAKAKGKQEGNSPIILKNQKPGFPQGYPSYEIITVKDNTDIIEHRKMEPIFYVTDDPVVWAELGVSQNRKQ